MKRKITVIMAADIAGYSKLVAEDEEETLGRLASYRAVFDDFIARASGRVFNTAGDAILAEFPSAVEAVRCAIDVQESLRTRNLAYPPSRQMNFRIGMTIGDVVERDGDLLGDGVNIAARLEGLAAAGGLCVSRAIYEQVANKMSVDFADIGEQHVKNIPSPIHAYTLALGSIETGVEAPPRKQSSKKAIGAWPVAAAAASVAVFVIAALLYLTVVRTDGLTPMVEQKSSPPPALRQAEALVPEAVPFISDRDRTTIRSAHLSAQDHKALAISLTQIGFISGQKDDDTAKAAALESCRKTTDAGGRDHRCELYALGNAVVYSGGRPPLPPEPWLVRNVSIERPFAAEDIPLVNDGPRAVIAKEYTDPGKYSKALAVSPRRYAYYRGQPSPEEAMRRALEACGSSAGIPCMIVAVNDSFVVPIPTTMKVVGFFRAGNNAVLAPEVRDDVMRRIGNATNGWNAVAVGSGGRSGLVLKATNEQDAIDGALAECSQQDHNCRVIAIGPFLVEPKNR
jgi:class 3 adenylate cyclase